MNYIGYKTKAFEVIKEAPIEYQKDLIKVYSSVFKMWDYFYSNYSEYK